MANALLLNRMASKFTFWTSSPSTHKEIYESYLSLES